MLVPAQDVMATVDTLSRSSRDTRRTQRRAPIAHGPNIERGRRRRWSGSRAGSLIAPLVASALALACSREEPSQDGTGASPGSGGATTGTGATGGSNPGTGGGSGGSGGAASGAGGSGGSSAGAGGATGGSGGATGGAAATGGSAGSGDAVVNDSYAIGIEIEVHDRVNTILVVTWTQATAADQTWLEFEFEDGDVMTSRPAAGTSGPHRDVVLGVPEETDVTLRVVSRVGGVDYVTSDHVGRTGAVPSVMPRPTVLSYDAALASPDRFLFGSLEDSPASVQTSRNNYYTGQFWLYIIDRKGRIVWYYNNPANNASSSFQRIARDGEYIWVDQGRRGDQGVVKMTLDHEYFERFDKPVGDCIDVTPQGTLLYDVNGELFEWTEGEGSRSIWSCEEELDLSPNCYSNTINYDPGRDTVMLSFPEPGAVVEIQRETGEMVGYFGNQPGTWAFAPPLTTPPEAWRFGIQHFPNLTPAGTLIVSSHLPPHDTFSAPPSPNEHAFVEFALDRDAQTLTEVWRYTDGPEWPHAKGMAIRLPNGNTLANYGTGGVIREITPSKQTAF